MGEEAHFYSNAEVYWRDVAPTVDGMLGGYGSISNVDLNGSKAFLKKFTGVRYGGSDAEGGILVPELQTGDAICWCHDTRHKQDTDHYLVGNVKHNTDMMELYSSRRKLFASLLKNTNNI